MISLNHLYDGVKFQIKVPGTPGQFNTIKKSQEKDPREEEKKKRKEKTINSDGRTEDDGEDFGMMDFM